MRSAISVNLGSREAPNKLTGIVTCRDTADADIEKIVLPENHPFAVQKKVGISKVLEGPLQKDAIAWMLA